MPDPNPAYTHFCTGCGRGGTLLTDHEVEQGWHVQSEHSPDCDGTERRCLETCPVAVQCGPVQRV